MRFSKPIAAVAAAAMLFTACSDGSEESTPSDGTGTEKEVVVVIAAEQELTSFNTSTSADGLLWGRMVSQLVWPQGTHVLPDYSTEPGVLEKAPEVVSEEPFTVEWTIRENANWSDGTPISADDLEYYWESCNGAIDEGEPTMTIDPETGEPTEDGSGEEVTAVDCLSTESYSAVSSFEKLNKKTVRTVFDAPFPEYESLFIDPLVPAHIAQERGENAWGEGFADDPGVSGGPYMLDEWVKSESLTLVKNPDWYGEEAEIDEIVFQFVADPDSQPDALRNGEVDVVFPTPNVDLFTQLQEVEGTELEVAFGPNFEQVSFNGRTPALTDVNVRKAIAHGIDRETIVDAFVGVYDENVTPLGNRVFMPEQTEYKDHSIPFDVDAAKALLEESGYTMGSNGIYEKDGQPLVLRLATTGGNQQREQTEELIKSQLVEIGIEIRIENREGGELFDLVFGEPEGWDLALFSFVGTPFPTDGVASLYATEAPPNMSGWAYSDPKVDALISEAQSTVDRGERVALLNELDAQMWETLPNVPLFQAPTLGVWNSDLQGVEVNPTTEGLTWNAYNWSFGS